MVKAVDERLLVYVAASKRLCAGGSVRSPVFGLV